MKRTLLFAAAMALVPTMAAALTVDYGAGSVNVQPTASGGVNVQTNVDGVKSNVNVTGDGSNTNVNVNGTTVNLRTDGSSLNVLVNGNLSDADRTVLVNLSGGSEVRIKTQADLDAYNSLVVQERPAIVRVFQAGNTLHVQYKQHGKFLGLIGADMNGTVIVAEDGTVSVQLPWYSFLFSKDTTVVTNGVTASITGAKGSVSASVLGSAGTDSVTVRSKAKLVNVVTSGINSSITVSK